MRGYLSLHMSRIRLFDQYRMDCGQFMRSFVDRHTVRSMLFTLKGDDQHAAIAKFIQHVFDVSQEGVTLLHD